MSSLKYRGDVEMINFNITNRLFVGSNEIEAVYLGNALMWQLEKINDDEVSQGCVYMGTYTLNEEYIPANVCTVDNFEFNLRGRNATAITLRSTNWIAFKVDRACTLSMDSSGKSPTLTTSNGSINGSLKTYDYNVGTDSAVLTAGLYTISGSQSGSNTTMTELRLEKK